MHRIRTTILLSMLSLWTRAAEYEHIRCEFVGIPELVSRPSRNRRGYRFRHDFAKEECTGNTLPNDRCLAGIHQSYHCGRDEQWKVSASPPSMEWTNWRPCENGIANVSADFLCGPEVKKCRFRGQPTKKKGWMSHEWTDEGCSGNYKGCIVANNEMTHCGGDHDWTIRDGTTTWYDSFVEEGCDQDVSIGMDIVCDKDHVVNCRYEGETEEERCETDVTERHANAERTGKCFVHRFDRNRDCDGKDVKDCTLGVIRSAKHCGQEEDWRVGENGEVRWWNAQSGCGNVSVEVDFYCGSGKASSSGLSNVNVVGGGDAKGDGGLSSLLRGGWMDEGKGGGVKRSEGWRTEAQGLGGLDESHS